MRSKTGRSLKKFLSFLLTLSMVLGMLPTFALAADTLAQSQVIATGDVDKPAFSTNRLVDYTISAVNQLAENGGDLYANVTYTFTFNTYTGADRPALDLKVGGTRVITYDYPGGFNENCAFTNQHANASVSGNVVTYTPGLMKLNSSFALENGAVEVGSTGTNDDRFSDAFTLPVRTVSYTDTAAAADPATIPGNMYVLNGTVIPVGAAPTVQSAYAATHTFESWGGNTPGGDLTITGDTTLDAVWTLATYPVTYTDTTGDASVTGLPAAGIATYGVDYTVSSTVPTRDKYSFAAWELGGSTYPAGGTVPASVFGTAGFTLTATWSYDGPTITSLTTAPTAEVGKTFTATAISDTAEGYVSFSYDGVTKVVPVVPAYPTGGIATVDFAVFAAGTEQLTALQYGTTLPVKESLPVQTDVVAVAAGMASKHTVKFYDGYTAGAAPDASMLESIVKVEDGTTVTAPVVTKDGMVFKGWNKWEDTHGATALDPADGYVQDDELTSFALNTPITKDTILIAEWTAEPTYYDVVFNPGCDALVGNMPADGKVEKNQTYTIPVQAPVRTDYEFKGWATTYGGAVVYEWNDSAFTPAATPAVTDNVTLYAVWAPVQVNVKYLEASTTAIDGIKSFTVKNGATTLGEGDSGNSVAKNSVVTITIELKDGYDPSTLEVLAGDKPLYGLLSGGKYIYEFKAEQNTEIKISETLALKQFTITLPQGDGYATEFVGCTPNDADGKTSHTFKYGEKFKVKLTVQPDIKATLKIDGETAAEIDAGATAQNKTSSEVVVKKEHNVSVAIEKKIIRTVTYSLEPHSGLYTTQLVENNTAATKPADPEIRGYNFNGKWYTKPNYSVEWNFDDAVTADMILYGKLTAKKVNISYDENSPTGDPADVSGMPTSDTEKTYGESAQLDAAKPTLEGYNFMGWATSANGPVAYQPGETFITELDANITLYAVWQIKTYTVTMPAGTGYSVTPSGVNTVEWMSDFTFTLNVDRQYAATEPVVEVNGVALDETSGDVSHDSAASWTYTIEDITENKTVEISVTKNAVHTVKFYVSKDGADEADPFLTQSVEHGYYATMPAAPDVEGYVFDAYYKAADKTGGKFPFEAQILGNTNVYAYYTAITPEVVLPADGTGWTITFDGVPNIPASQTGNYDYGEDAEFVITVQPGYDMTNIKVSVNDNLWAYTNKTVASDGTVTLEYIIHNLTEEVYNVRVTDIERKTVTVTYMPNAKDDVSGWTGGQEQINYYIGAADDGKITSKVPSRTGYEFLGWSLDADRDPAEFDTGTNADRDFVADEVAGFTTDTTLYAIWKASKLTVDLTFDGDYKYDDSSTSGLKKGLDYFYEGDTIALKATLSANAQGTMTFYQMAYDEYDPDPGAANAWDVIGTASINGGKVGSVTTVVAPYEQDSAGTTAKESNYRWVYKVEFEPTGDEGYVACADADDIRIYSKAISWNITKPNTGAWTNAENELSIYKSDGATTVTQMEANTVYYLQIPMVVELDGGRVFNGLSKNLTVGEHYVVDWEYKDANNDWVHYTTITDSDRVKVEAQYSQYSFRAKVTPAANSIYTKAAKYDAGTVVADAYMDYLITEPTAAVVTKNTTTTLVIVNTDGKLTEAANVVINGDNTVFAAEHLAQFEGDKITLKATVKETDTDAKVTTGTVKFYRYVNGTSDELLNIQDVAVDSNGVATYTVEVDDYDTGKVVGDNIDQFYAVYEDLADDTTWTKSDSKAALAEIYIKSTTIKTPVIDEINDSSTVIGSTTYGADLDGLLAGVKHTFKLRTGNAAADWSVVALDGRTVASTDYDIVWNVKTGDNTVTDATVGGTFVTSNNKVGDEISVTLNPKGDMTKGATSKKAIIGTKQDVNVTVTASDEITSTTDTDVYQLNPIILTAEVQGKDSQIMLPTGNVTFYYSVNGTNWVEIGTAALKQDDVSRTMKATFVTDKLPVDVVNGYKQEEVTITAIYSGDTTFEKSGEFETATKTITDTVAGAVTDETVTVYSSVVLVHAAEENTAVTSLTDGGIHITANGSLVANETDVALTLQQVYTLDYNIDLSKLVYGTDYTVEWQILKNASLYNDGNGYYGDTEKWNDIDATGSSYTIGTVPQDAAYRAKITVTDTAPVQGSAQGVLQAAADDFTTGRQVYYSNVLVVGAGQATVTTNITTSANTKFNEEGIVEGETVTIHALVAGASNVTPISNLTVTVTPKGSSDVVFTDELTTVNGYNAFTWNTTGVTPGYYTLTVKATSNNGYAPQTITRTLIVRDKTYTLIVNKDSKVYNGKAQGIDWTLGGIDIENALAQKSVVVYYYKDGKMVEPTQAGTYNYELYLPASAYWTELTHVTGTFTIEKRTVNVVDLVAQAKVYDGTNNVNIQEIILEDAATDQGTTGLPTSTTGVINGDSIYATGVMAIDAAGAGTRTLSVSNVTLHGDDANNYTVGSTNYTETINVQRSQVKGDIADSTFQYTGSNITVPADDIYLIDQAGNVITPANYTVTYYYHNGDGVEQVDAMNKLGKYTVIARPEQDNYKGGASQIVYVVSDNANDAAPTAPTSALIDITNTVELYGNTNGVVATATKGTAAVQYYVNGAWTDNRPTDAGRYLVKASVTNDTVTDTAYGIYTIVKARPEFAPTTNADEVTYNSAPYSGTVNTDFVTGKSDSNAETYITYTGGTIQGIAYEAPTEVGKYIATVHVGETANYTAHEEQVAFEIKPKALTITADNLARWQYGSYPDMVATFEGLATGGVAADTSLRDVQIQPEFIFNDLNSDGQPEYTNSALDQVGKDYPITVRNALARNYTVTYVAGSYAVNELDPKADLAIHGMIDNGTTTENIAYYGDEIQLYAYGNYKSNGDGTGVYNPSSLLEWSLSAGAPATIDQDGLLTITGVGTFNVTLTRGSGDAKISTSIEITALKQEIKIIVPNEDMVYSATSQSYNKGNISAVNGKLETITDPVTSKVTLTNDRRTNVGSQIVNAVVSGANKYQSETYGGLFTINDKEVTINPVAGEKTYGADTYTTAPNYAEVTPVGGVPALTDASVVSVTDLYNNLDVGTYEILVAGRENINYNVKYTTDPAAADVTVGEKALTVKTGAINGTEGMTSGSVKPAGKYPVDGKEVLASWTLTQNTMRMYGEPNWVMVYGLDALITGDSLADLVNLNLTQDLVNYALGIDGDANLAYDTKALMTGKTEDDYMIEPNTAELAFGNYTEDYTTAKGKQNIYQRPVTLKLANGADTLDVLFSDVNSLTVDQRTAYLRNLIVANLNVLKYTEAGQEVGGLATLLKHTANDLDYELTYTYNTSGFDVTIKAINNYWSENYTIHVNVVKEKYRVVYNSFTATSATVTLYHVNLDTGAETAEFLPSGNLMCKIFIRTADDSYLGETPVVNVAMQKTSTPGVYTVTYPRLVGSYRMFAIAEGGDGYTIVNGIE